MKDFGTCDHCTERAILIVNDNRACVDHINEAMAAGFLPVKKILSEEMKNE